MEMHRKLSVEGESTDATQMTTQTVSGMPPSDEELAIRVITTYLLAQSKEFQQLSQLRQQVSLYFSLYFNHWHVTNKSIRDGITPKATNISPINLPVRTLHTRVLRRKPSRARKSSSR